MTENTTTLQDCSMLGGYPDMLGVNDLAEILGVSVKTVQHQCARGDLPAVKIGRRWYVARLRLVNLLMSGDSAHSGRAGA